MPWCSRRNRSGRRRLVRGSVRVHRASPSRHIRSSSYLFLLALSDVFFLVDLLPGWINTNVVRSLYHGNNLICKVQTYVAFVASFVHIWMVLAFTAERFFAVSFPLKHMSQCTTNFSRTIILIIVAPAFVFYVYPSFFASEVDTNGQCREKVSHVRYLSHINTIDTIMTMFLPFAVVSILNVLIIRKLFCSKKFRKHVFDNGSSYQCQTTSPWAETRSRAMRKRDIQLVDDTSKANLRKSPSPRPDAARRHVLTELRLTKMLLAISFTCLSLNFPSYYSRLLSFYEQTKDDVSSNNTINNNDDYSTLALHRDILFYNMSYLSYSINIFIYVLFGANFRRALKRLCSPRKNFFSKMHKIKSCNHNNAHSYSFHHSITQMTATFNGSVGVCAKPPRFVKQDYACRIAVRRRVDERTTQ